MSPRTVSQSLCHLFLVFFVAFCLSGPTHASLPRLGRLTQEIINPGASQRLATYSHDLRGKRSARTASATALPPAQTFEYDDNDRLRIAGTPSVQFGYDANGNTRTSPWYNNPLNTHTDSYNAENRLIKRVSSVSISHTMGYDHNGNRVWKHSDNSGAHKTLFYLVDELSPTGYPQVVLETVDWTANPSANNATFFAAYEYGLRPISLRYYVAGTYWFIHDGHGSTRAMATSGGAIVSGWDIDYDAYGNTLTYDGSGNLLAEPNISIDMHIRYAGEQWDRDLRMYYLRARYYSPENGRFWNRDSYEGSTSDPGTLHKYLYCGADPVNRRDPSGNLSVGSTLSAVGIEFTVGTLSAGVAAEAQGRAITFRDAMLTGGLLGAGMGPFAVAYPMFGAGLGAFSLGYSVGTYGPIIIDGNSTYDQKVAASTMIVAGVGGAHLGLKYANAVRRAGPTAEAEPAPVPEVIPQFPLPLKAPPGIVIKSLQPGLNGSKLWQIPGLIKSFLDGGQVAGPGGYRQGNTYYINEGNHRIAAALEGYRQTGNANPLFSYLRPGNWVDREPPGPTWNMTED